MDYQLYPQETKLQENITAFCQAQIAPRARLLDRSSRREAGVYMKENLQLLAQAGGMETGHGDNTIDLIAAYLAGEEIAKACPATFLSARASAFLCAGALRLFGSPKQKQQYITSLLSAEQVGACAYSEEQAGSDIAMITTVARKEGDVWLLNGAKNLVVNAPLADVFLVLAYTEKGASDMSIFICNKETNGFKIEESVETMGLRGVSLSGISMDNCVAQGILGDVPGEGYQQMNKILTMGKIGIAALCVGIGSACIEISVRHAKNRIAFGKPIGLYQDVGFRLADMFTINDLARMLALKAAWAINTERNDAEVLSACAKLFASEAATKITNWGMQIFAGHGYVAGSDIERLYRDAKFGEICEGTSEIQRSVIARNELDRYAQN